MEVNFSTCLYALYLIFILKLLYKLIKWLIDYSRKVYLVNKIPGKQFLPFIGNAHVLKRKDAFFTQIIDWSKEFDNKPLFRIWIGTHPQVLFHKPDYLDILFSSSKNTEKSFFYNFLHPWFGTGLLTSHGEKWQNRRRLITPSFHYEILNDFLQVMNEQAEILTNILETGIKESKNNEYQVEIFKKLCLCTLDIICETAMGQNVNAQKEDSQYVKAVSKMSEVIFERWVWPPYWNDFYFSKTKFGKEHEESLKILISFTKKVIQERNKEFENNGFNTGISKRVAFLDMLLKAKHDDPTLTFDDIQEEVDTFMFEGHDTTCAAAGWACQLIGSHPGVQTKIHKELDSILGSSDRHFTSDDLKEMKYLECVIKETLRLFPSVPFFSRTMTQDENIGGYHIPKGASATILAYWIHRDKRYFPDPEKFDPDRFLVENTLDRHPYSYIPFSAGRRNCIGQRFAQMEEKVLLASILRKFEIKSLNTLEEVKVATELTIRPSSGINVVLRPRHRE